MKHDSLIFDVSPNAEEVEFKRPSALQRFGATQPSGRAPKALQADQVLAASTFPAPLVLPGDELSWDPKYPPQSARAWKQAKERNAVTAQRRKIYVVGPPDTAETVSHVNGWTIPDDASDFVTAPAVNDIVDYLSAFYHGLPVTLLQTPRLRYVNWSRDIKQKASANSAWAKRVRDIGLETGDEAIRIRARKQEVFAAQLNLNDLLDAAISVLPEDAYALLMLVNHDLYEDEEDDFCCGRAYGGSRVAVVSTARYHPGLDSKQDVDRHHAWPASHCEQYMEKCCSGEVTNETGANNSMSIPVTERGGDSAMGAALKAYEARLGPVNTQSAEQLRSLWLARVCTAGLSEDARQPPYLCPVDTAKLLAATGAGEQAWLRALSDYCERFTLDTMFAAFAAWIRVRIEEIVM
ncbi:hypothetical protein LTR56_021692 [Elasticomyces elasticus]|nr:hypothetical protein LTR56_021692 [Elasticomyces elasticus]KAK3664849.1 hypothetical protein LTR22_004439 [Elasticomyces elasticus]KAK4928658.1 hypothetical protein LTR49_004781 [Elasticomyces elasticus]KAK5765228.1 hypothetical protein LTS12_004742 [Elasticomyces elasticus]